MIGYLLVQHLPKIIVGVTIPNLSPVARVPLIVPILMTMQAMPEKV